MKIALVVFRYGPSHGSILQTYALTRTLEKMGYEVTIIDRQKPATVASCIFIIKRVIRNILRGKLSIYDFYLGEFHHKLMENLNIFIDKELRKQTITVTRDWQLKKIGKAEFDAYIVGSDQTWRPKYVYDIYNYFLDFVPQERKVKRLAYAASFGTAEWEYTEEQEVRCRDLVRLFDAVSVREKNGVDLCLNHFGIKAEHVLDPTMLLSKEDYLKFVISEGYDGPKYAGICLLDMSEEKQMIINKITKTLSVENRQLVKPTQKAIVKIEDRIQPTITKWLSDIYHSEIVVTDSFHATVFSIIFHKNFITIGNKARGMDRFESLLAMLGLEDRLVTNSCGVTCDLLKRSIDYNDVYIKISKKRTLSLEYLLNHLGYNN